MVSDHAQHHLWNALGRDGERSKEALLASSAFVSMGDAAQRMGIDEGMVQQRVNDGTLLALTSTLTGDVRLPVWALDPAFDDPAISRWWATALATDPWDLYHVLSTAQGALHGLRPFECLVGPLSLPKATQWKRDELLAFLQIPSGASLLSTVQRVVAMDSATLTA